MTWWERTLIRRHVRLQLLKPEPDYISYCKYPQVHGISATFALADQRHVCSAIMSIKTTYTTRVQNPYCVTYKKILQ